ncbi:unnamed protein product [Lactuca saligna]|uniref:Uncharacterized protein n=1 Tax=Lactuca saligna TaxID=75948 RepID=A0AA35V1Q3_LACSI|nr:unnamed protein product [Lactuca saligna]
MSSQHKGLIEAVKAVIPCAEHRQCVRNIIANFKKMFAGAMLENLFGRLDPKTWSRAFDEVGKAYVAVENSLSESFNVVVVEARRKPIITFLEEIRENYNKTYLNNMLPMNDSNIWPDTSFTPPLPPQRRRMHGRHIVKRKRDVSERMGKHNVSKKGRVNGGVGGEGGGLHGGVGGEGGGVHDVPMSGGGVNSRGVCGAVRTRKPSERLLKTKLAKAVYGKNGEGSSTKNPMDID